MRVFPQPSAQVQQALNRLRSDRDFQELVAYVEHSLAELDAAARVQMDAVILRQQQGAAMALAEFIERAQGKEVRAVRLNAA